jgi:hypothetical protein
VTSVQHTEGRTDGGCVPLSCTAHRRTDRRRGPLSCTLRVIKQASFQLKLKTISSAAQSSGRLNRSSKMAAKRPTSLPCVSFGCCAAEMRTEMTPTDIALLCVSACVLTRSSGRDSNRDFMLFTVWAIQNPTRVLMLSPLHKHKGLLQSLHHSKNGPIFLSSFSRYSSRGHKNSIFMASFRHKNT